MMVKRNPALFGRMKTAAGWLALAVLAAGLAGCAQQPAAVASTATAALPPPATATHVPSATPTLAPTATNAPVIPSATPTLPPTATPVPPLAVLPDGVSGWCAPQSFAGGKPTGPDAPAGANLLGEKDGLLQVKIPAAYCAMAYRFNQPAPEGASLVVFDGSSPFLKIPLTPVEGQPDLAWAPITHDYAMNPPYWEVTFRLVVADAQDQELWSQPVKFAKPLPAPCPYGGLPDPVTLYCAVTDPLELEPRPGVTFPAYYTREP